MKHTITKAVVLIMALLLHNKANAQLVPPSAAGDIFWVAGGSTVINTALIDVYDPDAGSPNHPYKQLGACVYDGGGGGVVVRDFKHGSTAFVTFPTVALPATTIAGGCDVILGNKIGSNVDFIMAVAFVNNINQIEVDYFDITYTTPTTIAVTYNSRSITVTPTGYPLLGTVHIDVVAASSTLTAIGLPLCDRFFVTFDVHSAPLPGLLYNVYALYGNLNGYTLTVGPQKITNMCPWPGPHQPKAGSPMWQV